MIQKDIPTASLGSSAPAWPSARPNVGNPAKKATGIKYFKSS